MLFEHHNKSPYMFIYISLSSSTTYTHFKYAYTYKTKNTIFDIKILKSKCHF